MQVKVYTEVYLSELPWLQFTELNGLASDNLFFVLTVPEHEQTLICEYYHHPIKTLQISLRMIKTTGSL